MRYIFHPEAKNELNQVVDYYENCQPGLGLDFLEEVYAAIQRILLFSEAWTELSSNTRRCLVNRFPYGIIYQRKSDLIRIIAIMHLNKKPGYWKERL
jgi:plasmid stabilization system protein ParE